MWERSDQIPPRASFFLALHRPAAGGEGCALRANPGEREFGSVF